MRTQKLRTLKVNILPQTARCKILISASYIKKSVENSPLSKVTLTSQPNQGRSELIGRMCGK